MKTYIRKETKTDKQALEVRRDRLQVRIGEIWDMLALLQDPKATEERKAKALNLSSVYGMLSMLEALALIVDCVTTRVYLKKKDPDGKKTKIPVRYSVAMTGEDIAGAAIDSATLTDALVKIVRDQVLMVLDPEKKHDWFDENGVLRCPHYKEEDDEEEDGLTAAEEAEADKTDEERLERIREDERGILDKIKNEYLPKKEAGAGSQKSWASESTAGSTALNSFPPSGKSTRQYSPGCSWPEGSPKPLRPFTGKGSSWPNYSGRTTSMIALVGISISVS
jgi:hypothetical protein